ncbi:hypothetical protein HYQ46_009048 [Verticillium longisporum]|nr:hypothetical protein HYQ46_009048 [Verticillium longisporum]
MVCNHLDKRHSAWSATMRLRGWRIAPSTPDDTDRLDCVRWRYTALQPVNVFSAPSPDRKRNPQVGEGARHPASSPKRPALVSRYG